MTEKRGSYIFLVLSLVVISNALIFSSPLLPGETNESNFNLQVEIPSDYEEIIPGDTLWFTVKIMNLANDKRVDVVLNYQVLDNEERLIVSRSETVAIETQASFVGKIKIPEGTIPGEYHLKVTMNQSNGSISSISSGQVLFTLKSEEDLQSFFLKNKKNIIITAAVIVTVSTLLILRPRIKSAFEKRRIKSQICRMIRERKE